MEPASFGNFNPKPLQMAGDPPVENLGRLESGRDLGSIKRSGWKNANPRYLIQMFSDPIDATSANRKAETAADCGNVIRIDAVDVRASIEELSMIRKLQSGEYRLYSRKVNPKTGKRRNLGTFKSRAAAEKHERAVQYFKRH